MHTPKFFAITDLQIIEQFIEENGFATIVSKNDDYPSATHLPLKLETKTDGKKVLQGHFSRANAQWKKIQENEKVLAIFLSSAHAYISSSWYDHANASTWNYISAQVSGIFHFLSDEEVKNHLKNLTQKYEQHQKNPFYWDQMPKDLQDEYRGVVGFEIEIDKIECAYKLSQNRKDNDYKNIIQELRLSSSITDKLVADAMEKNRV